jgi:exodeoxyribonuclease VII small subunit
MLKSAESVKRKKMTISNIPIESLSYEQALAELEEITRLLEANPSALDEILTLFERGQGLIKHCASLLDLAELKVRQLSPEEMKSLVEE